MVHKPANLYINLCIPILSLFFSIKNNWLSYPKRLRKIFYYCGRKNIENCIRNIPVDVDAQNCILVCEISDEGFSYAIKDDDKMLIGCSCYHFDKSKGVEDYSTHFEKWNSSQSLLQEILKKLYHVLLLAKVYDTFFFIHSQENMNILNLLQEISRTMPHYYGCYYKTGIYNSYRVSTPVLSVINQNSWCSKQAPVLSFIKTGTEEEDKLLIISIWKVVMSLKRWQSRFKIFFLWYYRRCMYILLNNANNWVEDIPVLYTEW